MRRRGFAGGSLVVITALLIVMFLGTACSKAKEAGFIAPADVPPASASEMPVPVFATREQYKHALQAAADDAPDRYSALLSGFLVDPFTRVLIVGEGSLSYEARTVEYYELEILEGDHKGQRAFAARTAVGRGEPPTAARTMSSAARCAAFIDRLNAGRVDPADRTWLAEKAVLAQRIADGKLDPDDFALETQDLPCGEGAVSPFASAAARSGDAWTRVDRVSAALRIALAAVPLSDASKAALGKHVDALARTGAVEGKTAEDLVSVTDFCELAVNLKVKEPLACRAVGAKLRLLRARAEASDKAHQAAEEAKEQRCEPIRRRALDCSMSCMDRFEPGDTRVDACDARCDAMMKGSRCD
jgi:hypothetical protein